MTRPMRALLVVACAMVALVGGAALTGPRPALGLVLIAAATTTVVLVFRRPTDEITALARRDRQ